MDSLKMTLDEYQVQHAERMAVIESVINRSEFHKQVFLAVLPTVIALNRDGTDMHDDVEFALGWTDEAVRQYRAPEK